MGSNGETHEQTSLEAGSGPGLEGEEHDLEPEWAETALTGAAVGGSRHGHPDDGDPGRALHRGGVCAQGAGDVRTAVAERTFDTSARQPLTVTVSVGVALNETENDTPEMILKRADVALYRAKREGRNRVVFDAA